MYIRNMNAMLASSAQIVQVEQVIENDIQEVEDHFSKVNCSELRKGLYSIVKLIKDFVGYFMFCKGKKD